MDELAKNGKIIEAFLIMSAIIEEQIREAISGHIERLEFVFDRNCIRYDLPEKEKSKVPLWEC